MYKRQALGLCALVMLLEFLTYHRAYRIGYDEGMLTTPPVVVQKSDEKAMQNLSRFMADVFASPSSAFFLPWVQHFPTRCQVCIRWIC